jgi:hypothetical protein
MLVLVVVVVVVADMVEDPLMVELADTEEEATVVAVDRRRTVEATLPVELRAVTAAEVTAVSRTEVVVREEEATTRVVEEDRLVARTSAPV